MSFIAPEPAAITTPAPATLANDGFFPDIDIAHARQTLRLDGTVTDARLVHALTAAVIEVGNELRGFKTVHQADGENTLAAVFDAETVGGVSRRVHAYQRAVYCLAKADLIERMVDYDLSAAGQKRAQWLADSPDEQRRNARWAIADVLDMGRTTVELI